MSFGWVKTIVDGWKYPTKLGRKLFNYSDVMSYHSKYKCKLYVTYRLCSGLMLIGVAMH